MAFIEVTRIAGDKRMVVNTEYIIHLEKGMNGGTFINALGWVNGCDVKEDIDSLAQYLASKKVPGS